MRKKQDRFSIFGIGFLMGCVMVGLILTARANRQKNAEEEALYPTDKTIEGKPTTPLAKDLPESIKKGGIYSYNETINPDESSLSVWILVFQDNYPLIRISEIKGKKNELLERTITAADQFTVTLNTGKNKEDLKSALSELGFQYRGYQRKDDFHTVGIEDLKFMALPNSINKIKELSDLISSAKVDTIVFNKTPFSFR